MKKYLLLFCLLLSAKSVFAQVLLSDVRFIPPTFFVGDLVELHIDFVSDGPLDLEIPEILPQADWVDIRGLRASETDSGVTVVVEFTPFAPGTRSLPTMNLGAIQLQDIKIPTHSMLSASQDGVRRLRGQMVLPGTRLGLAVLLSLAAMAPFLFYGASRLIWNWARRSSEIFRIRRPARKFRRLLKRQRLSVGSEPPALWYSKLTDGLRTYLSERTGYDCRSATTAEIAVMKDFSVLDSPQGRLLDVLKNGDMVKFAGRIADDRSLERTLATVEIAVSEWEKANVQL